MIFYPTYFSPIAQYVAIANTNEILFEVEDNYQKQTYRTRCYIYSPNGRQLLNLPVQHLSNSRKTKDTKIDYSIDWQKQHLRAMQTAYQSSPYFEFYEDAIKSLFATKETYLLDFNFKCHELVLDFLQIDSKFTTTSVFTDVYTKAADFRYLADAKTKRTYNFVEYIQVFSDKLGFIENLSILDLIFMEGPNAENYLVSQSLSF